jgi:hypothetical protein
MDFRAYLQTKAPALLGFVGNDGGINVPKAQQTLGAGNFAGSALYGYKSVDQLKGDVDNMYADYQAQQAAAAAKGAGTAAGSGVANTDAQDLAYLDDQEGSLRGMLTSAQKTLDNGLTQIGDTYNKEVGRTTEQKTAAGQQYATKREDTTRDKQSALGRVDAGARTLSDSVRRMLGMASGQNSSAFQEAAPGMITRDATIKRGAQNETFGRNLRDIDTAETSTNNSFEQYLQDLGEQKKTKESGLREGVLGQEQQIYNNLGQIARDREAVKGGTYGSMRSASAPYQAEASARQSALDGLFAQFRTPFQTKDVAVQAPNLSDYTVDRTTLNANAQAGTQGDPSSPYSQFLKKKFAPAV